MDMTSRITNRSNALAPVAIGRPHWIRVTLLSAALCGCGSPTPPTDASVLLDAAVGPAPRRACVRPLAIERAEDIGAFSLPSPSVISRDGVSSGLFQGRVLWTFGDTFLGRRNTIDNTSVLSATSGWSTVADPLRLDEPVDANGLPSQLIPYTAEEIAANTMDAINNGYALWPGPVIDTHSDKALVLFQRIHRQGARGFFADSIGTARIAAGAAVAQRNPTPLFMPQRFAGPDGMPRDVIFGTGGVSIIDDYAYFFGCSSVGFLNNGCRVGRVPTARVDDRSAFEFFNGSQWTPDSSTAAPIIGEVGSGLSITYNPYIGCYLAVSGVTLRSAAALRSSERFEGGFGSAQQLTIEQAPNGPVMPANMGEYDYLFLEHPALRSADGRQVVISYSRPLGNFRGEVRLIRVTLR